MMSALELAAAGAILVALVAYALTGGADFGGGVWDLLARGPRARAQRELVEKAIGPIWEANHVWLIIVVVMCFAAFPHAYAAITTALHVPLALMLVGIVLRGSAFVFRAYGLEGEVNAARWGRAFAITSAVTPLLLGNVLGAIASGTIRVSADGIVQTDFVSSWLAPFPIATGILVLSMFVYLAAVYLAVEAGDEELRRDFRRRALVCAGIVTVAAWGALGLARSGAPILFHGLTSGALAWAQQIAIGVTGLASVIAIWKKRDRLARVLAGANVSLVVIGFGLALSPYIVPPDLTIHTAAAPASALRPMLIVLGAGTVVLLPAFLYLYSIFTRRRSTS